MGRDVAEFLGEYREAVAFAVTVAVFFLGAWYGRTVEREEWRKRERARARFKYREGGDQ